MILHFMENLLDGIDISYLTRFLKKGCAVALGALVTVFSAIIAVEGLTFAGVDGITVKAVKYATSSLVPIVGGFLSGSLDTISGFVLVIKNTVGVMGMLVVVSIVLAPAARLFLVYLALRFSAIVVQPFAEKRFSGLLDNAAECMLFIDSCVIVVGVMFIVMIALFLQLGNYMVMMR
jgi:stage III sporulation protein AE